MRSAIEVYLSRKAHFIDTARYRASMSTASTITSVGTGAPVNERLAYYAYCNAQTLIQNLHEQMLAHSFRSRAYTRRDLNTAFAPLLRDGIGFTSFAVIGAYERNFVRAAITPR